MTREEAINKLNWALNNNMIEDVQSAYDYIMAIKMAIEALEQEPKTGQWIDTDNYYQRWKCSECGYHTRDAAPPFCPNCGTKMIETPKSEGLSSSGKPNNRMKYRVFTERDGETAYLIQFYGRWWIVFKHKNYDSPVIGLWFDTLEEGTDYMLMNGATEIWGA